MMIFIVGLRLLGMMVMMLLDGLMYGVVFLVYVEKVLFLELREGDIVVMDNFVLYKVVGVC